MAEQDLETLRRDFIPRPEANEAFRSLRREMNEVKMASDKTNTLLQTLLQSRTEEARSMGRVEADVRQLQVDVRDLKENQVQPTQNANKAMWDVLKLVIAAALGWFIAHK